VYASPRATPLPHIPYLPRSWLGACGGWPHLCPLSSYPSPARGLWGHSQQPATLLDALPSRCAGFPSAGSVQPPAHLLLREPPTRKQTNTLHAHNLLPPTSAHQHPLRPPPSHRRSPIDMCTESFRH
jgi:hypothetical protein